jgi:hypothetical protein
LAGTPLRRYGAVTCVLEKRQPSAGPIPAAVRRVLETFAQGAFN